MSPPWVESSSAPRVAIKRWIGTATETIVSPSALTRTTDCGLALQRGGDFRHRLAVGRPSGRRPLRRRRRQRRSCAHRRQRSDPKPRRSVRRVGQIRADERAARRERARIEQELAVAVVDARARARRRDEPVQHRADALGIDRELDRVLVARRRRDAFARRELQQLFRIDGDRVGVDRRRGGDRRGDDLGLRRQALDARLDEVGAELVEQRKPTSSANSPPRLRTTMRRVSDEEKRARQNAPSGRARAARSHRAPAAPAQRRRSRSRAAFRRSWARPSRLSFLEAIADAVKRLDHFEIRSTTLNFLRSRLMWLSMVRSST